MKTKTHDEDIPGKVAKRLLNVQDPQPVLDIRCPHCTNTLRAEFTKEHVITYFHDSTYGIECPNVYKRYRVSIPVIEIEP